MFIKLTNASPKMENETLLLKKEIIVSVFKTNIEWPSEEKKDSDSKIIISESVTVVYCGSAGTWHAKESTEEIYNMLQ